MISKELLSEVLGIKINKIHSSNVNYCYMEKIQDTSLCFDTSKQSAVSINVYELTHKCKEWAYSNGFVLTSSYITPKLKNLSCPCGIMPTDERFETIHITNASTEPEAIFKACEWILENK